MNKRSFETGIYTSNAVKKFIKFCATNRIAHDEIGHLLRTYSLPSAHTGDVNHEAKTKPAPGDILALSSSAAQIALHGWRSSISRVTP